MSRRRHRLQPLLTPEEHEAFLAWCSAEGKGHSELIGDAALAWYAGRLFIADTNTFQALQSAFDDRTRKRVTRWATEAVLKELYRQGFTVTPHDK